MKKIISIIKTLLVLYTALIFMSIYPMLITVGRESFDLTKWLDADQYFVRPIYISLILVLLTYVISAVLMVLDKKIKNRLPNSINTTFFLFLRWGIEFRLTIWINIRFYIILMFRQGFVAAQVEHAVGPRRVVVAIGAAAAIVQRAAPIDDAAHMLEQFTRIDQEQGQFAAHGGLASMHLDAQHVEHRFGHVIDCAMRHRIHRRASAQAFERFG